jgi:hypothetical protein
MRAPSYRSHLMTSTSRSALIRSGVLVQPVEPIKTASDGTGNHMDFVAGRLAR